jgi:integrase
MAKQRLDDTLLRSLKPPEKGQTVIWDTNLAAFGCRVSQGGSKTFIINHKKTFLTIGRYPIISLSEARTEAKRMMAEFTLGKIRPQSITYEQAVKLFLQEKGERRKARTVADHKRHLNKLGFKCQMADVTHQDLERKLKRLRPSEFNHRLSCAKTFFKWAQDKRYITDNPTVGLTPHKRPKRKRTLTDDELRAVWLATDQLTGHFKEIVRLLILMGQRRGETAALRDTYYGDNAQILCLPAEITKNGREHAFPVGPMAACALRAMAAEILARNIRKERPSSLLFQAVGSDSPFSGWSKCKAELDKLAPIAPWTLHDLRRTFRTTLGRLKVRPDIAERLVNHISARTEMEETYDLYTYLPEMREAMEMWETFVRRVCIDIPASCNDGQSS